MRRLALMIAGISAALLLRISAAQAQRLTVQEPVLETFGVGTTVSVPDRGRASLGGVRRSAASRSTFGPLRSGTNVGWSQQASGASVGVYIQDLEEMDRRILADADRARNPRVRGAVSAEADRAYESLRAGNSNRTLADGARRADLRTATQEPASNVADADLPSADQLVEKARRAEANGKRGLALAFYRTARDLGSDEAREDIERLSPTKK